MAQSPETRQFAAEQVDRLLGQLAFQVSRTLRPHDPISVHHLRVAVRRFSRALLVFEPYFRAQDVKKIRRRLEEIMVPARELRDCDLAINLLSIAAGAAYYGILSNPFLETAFQTLSFRIHVTVNGDGTWSYEEDTVMQLPDRDRPFHHTDRNTMTLVAPPTPNPLAAAGSTQPVVGAS